MKHQKNCYVSYPSLLRFVKALLGHCGAVFAAERRHNYSTKPRMGCYDVVTHTWRHVCDHQLLNQPGVLERGSPGQSQHGRLYKGYLTIRSPQDFASRLRFTADGSSASLGVSTGCLTQIPTFFVYDKFYLHHLMLLGLECSDHRLSSFDNSCSLSVLGTQCSSCNVAGKQCSSCNVAVSRERSERFCPKSLLRSGMSSVACKQDQASLYRQGTM